MRCTYTLPVSIKKLSLTQLSRIILSPGMAGQAAINFSLKGDQSNEFPILENPTRLTLSPVIEKILRAMFADYRRLILRQEFGAGLSSGRAESPAKQGDLIHSTTK